MLKYLIRLVVCGIVVWLIPQYIKDVSVADIQTGLIVAFGMSLLNTFVKPILKIISIPISILTLGLFSLVITVAMVYLCSYFVPGFKVNGFIGPLVFSFILSITNGLIHKLL